MQVDELRPGSTTAMHEGVSFFQGLIEHTTALPIVAMVWEGPNAIANVRAVMVRPTRPRLSLDYPRRLRA